MKKTYLRKFVKKIKKRIHINWRDTWYSLFLWVLVLFISGVVIIPWYYLVLPLALFATTIFYFRNKNRRNILRRGFAISIFWFATVAIMDFVEIMGPYYMNAGAYYSDFRNWIKYPLVLLVPVIYSLIQDNIKLKKSFRSRFVRTTAQTQVGLEQKFL